MGKGRTPILLTGGAVLIGVVRPWMVWGELPPLLASHFGADGTPDGMSQKTEFFVMYGLVMVFVLISLLGSVLLMEKIPVKYLNLPNKDYWLSSGKLPQAREKMSLAMWWMCAATMLLSTATLELVLQANLNRAPINSGVMWTLMGAYLIFSLGWVVKLLTAFTPPDKD